MLKEVKLDSIDFTNIDNNSDESISKEEFCSILSNAVQSSEYETINVANLITNNFIGFSKTFINSICENENIKIEIEKQELSDYILFSIYEKINTILNATKQNQVYFKLTDNQKDYYPQIIDNDINNSKSYFASHFSSTQSLYP